MTRIANEREEHRLMLKAFADKGETPKDKDGSPSIPKMFQCRKKIVASFLPINMVQIVMFLGQIYEKIVR